MLHALTLAARFYALLLSIYSLYGHAQVLKDWHLFVIVMTFVLVDVIILTVVSALDGVRFGLDRVEDLEFPSRPNVRGA